MGNAMALSVAEVKATKSMLLKCTPFYYEKLLGKIVGKTYKKDDVISKVELKNERDQKKERMKDMERR